MGSFRNSIHEFISTFKGPNGKANLYVAMVWGSYLMMFLKWIFLRLPVINMFAEYCNPALYTIVFIIAAKQLFCNYSVKDLFFWFACCLVFLSYYVFGPWGNIKYMEEYFPTFIMPVSACFFVGKSMGDEKLYKALHWISVFVIIMYFLYNYFIHPANEMSLYEKKESQGLAYTLLPYFLYVLWRLLEKFDIVSFLAVVLALFMLLSMGSRGPVLSVLVFIVLYLLFCKRFYRYWYVIVILAVGGYFVYKNITVIALGLQTFLDSIGYSTRIVDIFMEGESGSDEERQLIANSIISALCNKPFGLGICGTESITKGLYAHNIFLELIVSFGWILGGSLSLLLIVYILKGFVSCHDSHQQGLFIVLLCNSVVFLMVSGTFLQKPEFFMFLGYATLMIHNKKKGIGYVNG